MSIALTHSGYDVEPLRFVSNRHDAHHELFNVNFSTFGILDLMAGTYKANVALPPEAKEKLLKKRNKARGAVA